MKINKQVTLIIILLTVLVLSGCAEVPTNTTAKVIQETTATTRANTVEKIEVYHFHSTRQCSVCTTIGNNLDETIDRYFTEEVESGKLVYGHLNIELIQNKAKTELYGATGTSLWIGVYDENGFHAENDQQIWYKLQDKEAFIQYLKELIDKRLEGDMN